MTQAMSTTIITPDQDAVVSEIEIGAPAERIFRALTDCDQLTRWFNNPSCPIKLWKMEPRKGGRQLRDREGERRRQRGERL